MHSSCLEVVNWPLAASLFIHCYVLILPSYPILLLTLLFIITILPMFHLVIFLLLLFNLSFLPSFPCSHLNLISSYYFTLSPPPPSFPCPVFKLSFFPLLNLTYYYYITRISSPPPPPPPPPSPPPSCPSPLLLHQQTD